MDARFYTEGAVLSMENENEGERVAPKMEDTVKNYIPTSVDVSKTHFEIKNGGVVIEPAVDDISVVDYGALLDSEKELAKYLYENKEKRLYAALIRYACSICGMSTQAAAVTGPQEDSIANSLTPLVEERLSFLEAFSAAPDLVTETVRHPHEKDELGVTARSFEPFDKEVDDEETIYDDHLTEINDKDEDTPNDRKKQRKETLFLKTIGKHGSPWKEKGHIYANELRELKDSFSLKSEDHKRKMEELPVEEDVVKEPLDDDQYED